MTATRSRLWLLSIVMLILGASSCSSVSSPGIPGIDKIAHFALFGLLATHLHISGLSRDRFWLTVLLCSCFGFLDEFHQSFTPGRSVEFLDWLADTSGAAIAVFLLLRWRLYRDLLLFRLI